MPWISDRLRAPDGCPWDREQTHASLRKHLLEEAYEVYDALEAGATPELAEELGDLLLQIVLHAQHAAEAGVFDLADVQAALATKIVRRHPHVFGDAEARTAADVNRQWERIKADERAAAALAAAGPERRRPREGALDGICRVAAGTRRKPGDAGARRRPSATTGRRSTACSTRSPRRPRSCVSAATDDARGWAEEFGDLLFVLVNVAPQAGHRRGGRAARRRTPSSGAASRSVERAGRGARRRAARPRLRGARRAVGRRQGGGEGTT